MKKQIMIFALATVLVVNGFAQDARNNGTVLIPVLNDPLNLVQFQVRQKLFAHQQDGDIGSFGTTDQWSSLGRIDGGTQTLYGLRFQRAGKALTFGFS